MPEGPCVRRWGDIARQFIHKEIKKVGGVSKMVDQEKWEGAVINKVVVYGKQLFFHLLKDAAVVKNKGDVKGNTSRRKRTRSEESASTAGADAELSIWYRYHFLMWGSLRANEYKGPSKRSKTQKAPNPMIEFHFDDKTFLLFYGGSIRVVDGPCEDEGIDILSDTFDFEKAALAVLRPVPVCYTIMDQTHFAGAGNIVKNEVLYACRMHPLELGSNLTKEEAVGLAKEVVRFTNDWLKWEEEMTGYQRFGTWMKMYWKFKCPDGHSTKRGWFGDQLKRMTTWCPECQALGIESDIAKEELSNIGKIKSSKQVKRGRDEEEDEESDEMKPRKKRASRKSNSKQKSHVEIHHHEDGSSEGRGKLKTQKPAEKNTNTGRKQNVSVIKDKKLRKTKNKLKERDEGDRDPQSLKCAKRGTVRTKQISSRNINLKLEKEDPDTSDLEDFITPMKVEEESCSDGFSINELKTMKSKVENDDGIDIQEDDSLEAKTQKPKQKHMSAGRRRNVSTIKDKKEGKRKKEERGTDFEKEDSKSPKCSKRSTRRFKKRTSTTAEDSYLSGKVGEPKSKMTKDGAIPDDAVHGRSSRSSRNVKSKVKNEDDDDASEIEDFVISKVKVEDSHSINKPDMATPIGVGGDLTLNERSDVKSEYVRRSTRLKRK